MTRYRAAWVVPVSQPPIRDGRVEVDRGRILKVGAAGRSYEIGRLPSGAETGFEASAERDLGHVALMPGLVNAHTHLELSYLRGRVPPAAEFVSWIREVMAAQHRRHDPSAPEILHAVGQAIEEAAACGTALVGDISNTLITFTPLVRSELAAVVFHEVIRFKTAGADNALDEARRRIRALAPTELVRPSLAAHAPYSVGPKLLNALRRAVDQDGCAPCSVHVSESRAEVEFIQTGGGPWRVLLEEIGAWDPSWITPAVSPVEYLDRQGFFDARVLAVHGVQMSASDLALLETRGSTLVTCPRSNAHTGAGTPPLEAFYQSGVGVAVGTDSLASAPDLNVFSELAVMHALAPSVSPAALLDSATRQGARALGFESEFGTIEPGKRARLLAVVVPPGTGDVEEYLVSGIQPEQLKWMEE